MISLSHVYSLFRFTYALHPNRTFECYWKRRNFDSPSHIKIKKERINSTKEVTLKSRLHDEAFDLDMADVGVFHFEYFSCRLKDGALLFTLWVKLYSMLASDALLLVASYYLLPYFKCGS